MTKKKERIEPKPWATKEVKSGEVCLDKTPLEVIINASNTPPINAKSKSNKQILISSLPLKSNFG